MPSLSRWLTSVHSNAKGATWDVNSVHTKVDCPYARSRSTIEHTAHGLILGGWRDVQLAIVCQGEHMMLEFCSQLAMGGIED